MTRETSFWACLWEITLIALIELGRLATVGGIIPLVGILDFLRREKELSSNVHLTLLRCFKLS